MISIGIISPFQKENIRRCLKKILPCCATVSKSADSDTLRALGASGTDFCIIDLERSSCYVDILILDTCDKPLVSKALRSITPDTRLLYNSDCCPPIIHPYAISYGFSQSSTATVSSINETALILCLHPFVRLDNTVCGESEYLVRSDEPCVNNVLCAVACGALCGTVSNAAATFI